MRLLLLAFLLAAAPRAFATEQLASGDFLNIPVDVRVLGMGEAGQAAASGAQGITVNPAAINSTSGHEAFFTHAFHHSGIGVDFLGYAGTLGRHHFAANYHHVGYGTLRGIDDQGNASVDFGPNAAAYGFAYGTDILGADVAASLKYLDARILDTAQAVTFDLGAKYRLGRHWAFGVSGQNLAGELKYERENNPLPRRVAAGVGWEAVDGLWLALDVIHPIYSPSYVAIGSEYLWPVAGEAALFFRLGVNTRTPELGPWGAVKAGLGFRFRAIDLDYALNPAGGFGQGHHLGVTYKFGAAAPPPERAGDDEEEEGE